jgi:hypothetical protein
LVFARVLEAVRLPLKLCVEKEIGSVDPDEQGSARRRTGGHPALVIRRLNQLERPFPVQAQECSMQPEAVPAVSNGAWPPKRRAGHAHHPNTVLHLVHQTRVRESNRDSKHRDIVPEAGEPFR